MSCPGWIVSRVNGVFDLNGFDFEDFSFIDMVNCYAHGQTGIANNAIAAADGSFKLVRDFRPTLVLDAHEYAVPGNYLQKFGTVQKHDALFHYATTANLSEFLTKAAAEWYRRPLQAALKNQEIGRAHV